VRTTKIAQVHLALKIKTGPSPRVGSRLLLKLFQQFGDCRIWSKAAHSFHESPLILAKKLRRIFNDARTQFLEGCQRVGDDQLIFIAQRSK